MDIEIALKWLIERKKQKKAAQIVLTRTNAPKLAKITFSLISILIVASVWMPATAQASIFDNVMALITQSASAQENPPIPTFGNIQTMALPKPAMNIDPSPARGGGEVIIVDDSAVVAVEGPSGTTADIQKPKNYGKSMV